MNPKIKSVSVGPALNTAVFNHKGEQIPELQVSFPELFAKHLESHGYDPEGIEIETPYFMLNLFKTSEGNWNYTVTNK